MASDGEISCTNDPNFAVIYSFLKVFGNLYALEVPTIAELQELIENTQEVLDPLKEIHLRLLRRALKSVQSNKWERGLIKFCHQHGHHQEAWEVERFSYKKASTQVKLTVLKLLLEYQFTCYPKFKTAVNAISCKELRLEPIGRDKNGCVYWYQVDHDANLCLFKEDQDEETWQLVARNREELVKVIAQLKSGEEICPLVTSNTNEDSSSTEVPPPMVPSKNETEEDNEEEFLSPESESEHEPEDQMERKSPEKELSQTSETERNSQETNENNVQDAASREETLENIEDNKNNSQEKESKKDSESINSIVSIESTKELIPLTNIKEIEPLENINKLQTENVTEQIKESESESIEQSTTESIRDSSPTKSIRESSPAESIINTISPKIKELGSLESIKELSESIEQPGIIEREECLDKSLQSSNETKDVLKNDIEEESLSEAIEEPVMIVTGEGNGADCESPYIIGEEIIEEVMYFFGEGFGYDNDTGNPEAVEQENINQNTDEENGNEECVNGEHDISNISNKAKLSKGLKLRSSVPSVNKRALKKQNNDTAEVPKPETKKHCIRNLDKSDCPAKSAENERESSVNDRSTDSESPRKNNVKKGRNIKKKRDLLHKIKINEGKEVLNSVSETDNGHDSKASIIEKRKSSVSSVDQDEHEHTENEKDKSPDKEDKVEDPLPPKKLRLESTPESDINASHSKEPVDSVNNSDSKEIQTQEKDNVEDIENSISQRKKIKANKGKFKRKKILKNKADNDSVIDKSTDRDRVKDKKGSKSLKRTLLNTTMSDRNKSESQSDSEDDEPVTSGKRLKIKPKKIITSSRKKVEAKLSQKHSSDESEEETLYSIAGKKSSKKVLKKKPKGKEKQKDKKTGCKGQSEDSDIAPVRQSRRIAQMKIKEEADRRHLEEVALREMKMIHKKKNKDDEEEWQASCSSSEGGARGRGRKEDKWRAADSTGPEPDSDTDEPLFEHVEPDLDYSNKSDHEFSPESDLESGEPVEPLKRARTLREEKEDGGACERCGSGEQPEWILLCDRCDAGYHASCLKPLLLLVPEGSWYCPPCNHDKLISSLEEELTKYDELVVKVEAEREERAKQQLAKEQQAETQAEEDEKEDRRSEKSHSQSDGEGSSSDWSSSSSGAVYRLRARKQLPVSYRSQEYDRLISSAIKEEYVEPTTSAGNQGRGKDISTIIEAAEEEKLKAEREAIEQGKPIEIKKIRKKARRKPRKLNSLEVPSEDDDETDEDFKDTGLESSSEEISSSAERESSGGSGSSDSLPIARRTGRTDRKDRPKMTESSPEVKKKKKVFEDTSSESGGTKEWTKDSKKSKSKYRLKKRDKSKSKRSRKRGGLTQYDAAGNVIRARVTYGGLSDDEPNDWSPKHRTRQKKINYTEMPNTESEDEMHKSSGKHMPDSSDEFKIDDSDVSSSDSDRAKKRKPDGENSDAERQKAISDLIKKTAVVPLEKLPEDVTKAKTEELEELQAQLNAQQQQQLTPPRPVRGRGSRGGRGRGSGGGRGRGRSPRASSPGAATDDALAKLVGVKIKDLKSDVTLGRPNEAEREKKRQEREAKQAEKEARKLERLQKREEKEKLKELKAKEREEKRLARLALHESKRMKKEKPEYQMPGQQMGFAGIPIRASGPEMQRMNMFGNTSIPVRHPGDYQEQRFPQQPRLQVRAELRGVAGPEDRLQALRPDHPMREGTLSVAGSPQPFKPVSEEPSIITRMPHMINQQYRGPMMYSPSNPPYGPRAQNMMYSLHHPGMNPQARHQYPSGYYPPHLRGLPPPAYPPSMRPASPQAPHASPGPPGQGPHASPGPGHSPGMHAPPGPHGPHGLNQHGPPGRLHGPPGPGPHAHPGQHPGQVRPGLGPNPHGIQGPHGQHRPLPHSSPGPSPLTGHNSMPHGSKILLGPRAPPPQSPTPPVTDPPVKIKAEVKTEPEYRTPPTSPRQVSPPRHPKIKHTENKDRRPRYPHGPYAPQYGPYGPYAPPGPAQAPDPGHSPLLNLQARPPVPGQHPLQRMQQLHRLLPSNDAPERPDMAYGQNRGTPRPPYSQAGVGARASPGGPGYGPAPYADVVRPALAKPPTAPAAPPPEPEERTQPGAASPPPEAPADRKPTPPPPPYLKLGDIVNREPPALVKLEEPRDEGSVFGGLVSYFSSQREDDIDT